MNGLQYSKKINKLLFSFCPVYLIFVWMRAFGMYLQSISFLYLHDSNVSGNNISLHGRHTNPIIVGRCYISHGIVIVVYPDVSPEAPQQPVTLHYVLRRLPTDAQSFTTRLFKHGENITYRPPNHNLPTCQR